MKNQRKYQKGITLIALVITIIVLLILAGVTLNIVFNGGIINKSQTAVDKYTEEQAKEKLSLALFEYKMDKVTKKEGVKLETYLSKLGPVREVEDTNYYEVEIDGYLFWVHKDTLEIISKGPSNPVPPTKIEFSSSTDEAYIGEGKTFSLKLEPQNANSKFLKWSVNDESVAKIQNGVLTGLKEGTVTVIATSTEDTSITASCTVTVKERKLENISLNTRQMELGVDKTKTLEVTYTPANATYKDIVWSTSDDTVATVENGTVKGVKVGTATITATSVKNSSITAICNVTVAEILEIATVEQLKTFRDDVNNGNTYAGKKVVLTNDLDLNLGKYRFASDGTVTFDEDAEQWTAIGTETNYFAGSFDGKGHTISGLYINKPDENYQGLFGHIFGLNAGAENIKLTNINITGGEYTGGILGRSTNSTINKCMVSGNIQSNAGNDVGGIVGFNMGGTVNNCYNKVDVNASVDYVGGIVGGSNGGYINNCYNTGSVNGNNYVGGIIGETFAREINNCYNLGMINGNSYIGGIGGKLINANYCYNRGIVSGTTYLGGIAGFFDNQKTSYKIENCYYLTGTATDTFGYIRNSTGGGTATNVGPTDNLPLPLTVLNANGNDAWMEDANGNITLKFE